MKLSFTEIIILYFITQLDKKLVSLISNHYCKQESKPLICTEPAFFSTIYNFQMVVSSQIIIINAHLLKDYTLKLKYKFFFRLI